MAECFVDADCPGVQLCYQNTSASWLSQGINRCLCNTEYGWGGGPQCTEFGIATYYIAVSSGIYTCMAVLQTVFVLFVLSALLRNKKFKWNGLSFTLILVLLETIAVATKGAVVLTMLYTPERQTLELTVQGTEVSKAHDLLTLLRVLVALTIVVGFLAALHVSLVWMQIVSRSYKLSVRNKGLLSAYEKVVLGMEGIILLLLISFASMGNLGLTGIALLPFVIISVVMYTCAVKKLSSLLAASAERASAYSRVLSNIRQCYKGFLLSTICIICGSTGVGILSLQGYKEVTPAGRISTFVFFNEMVPWGLCLMMTSILIYVYKFVQKDMGSSALLGTMSKRKAWTGASEKDLWRASKKKYELEAEHYSSNHSISV